MNFLKKQRIGTWLTLAVAVLGIISLIVYIVNGSAEGYFKGTTSGEVVVMSVFSILCALGAVALAQLDLDGASAKAVSMLCDVLRVVCVVLLIASLLIFVGDRAEGLAYIFASDENVLAEVQTPANMSSAYTAILGFVFYGIAWLVALVTAFFSIRRKNA